MVLKSEYYPSSFQVCGNVASEHSHDVNFHLLESRVKTDTKTYVTQTEQGTGDFCQFLPPGKYAATVMVTQKETAKGIQFFPVEQIFSLTDHSHMGLFFSQLKATVIGTVKCIRPVDCENIKVHMKMENPTNKEMEDIQYDTSLDGMYVGLIFLLILII